MRKKKFELKMKDGGRDWWTCTAVFERQTDPSEHHDIPDYFETEWNIKITREKIVIFEGSIRTQYDEPPHLHDVLAEFTNYMNRTTLDFMWCDHTNDLGRFWSDAK